MTLRGPIAEACAVVVPYDDPMAGGFGFAEPGTLRWVNVGRAIELLVQAPETAERCVALRNSITRLVVDAPRHAEIPPMDIAPFAGLPNLVELVIRGIPCTGVDGLAGAPHLRILHIAGRVALEQLEGLGIASIRIGVPRGSIDLNVLGTTARHLRIGHRTCVAQFLPSDGDRFVLDCGDSRSASLFLRDDVTSLACTTRSLAGMGGLRRFGALRRLLVEAPERTTTEALAEALADFPPGVRRLHVHTEARLELPGLDIDELDVTGLVGANPRLDSFAGLSRVRVEFDIRRVQMTRRRVKHEPFLLAGPATLPCVTKLSLVLRDGDRLDSLTSCPNLEELDLRSELLRDTLASLPTLARLHTLRLQFRPSRTLMRLGLECLPPLPALRKVTLSDARYLPQVPANFAWPVELMDSAKSDDSKVHECTFRYSV